MFERGITTADVRLVLEKGEAIEEYPEPSGSPGRLMLGMRGPRPLHVVAASVAADHLAVITVYEPGESDWEPGFKKRRA
jgi:hypothetical protein